MTKRCEISYVLSFKVQCKQMFLKLTTRLLNDKSPAAFKIVKYLRCLDPKEIENNRSTKACSHSFKKVLLHLKELDRDRMKVSDRDHLHEKFRKFIE